MPDLTLHQLDTKHNIANPFHITKYDKDKCTIEVEEQESFPILSEKLHGAFCLTKEDFTKLKTKLQTDCKNQKTQAEDVN